MAPIDFKLARSIAKEEIDEDIASYRVTVDGKPYLPFRMVDSQREETVQAIVAELFGLSNQESMKVRPILGGNTNRLFLVSNILSDDNEIPSSVLVRVFGGEGMIERDSETSTFAALASQGIAPKYYGRFGNGRLEEWHDNLKHLEVDDFSKPELSLKIAKSLGKMHKEFIIPDSLKDHHDPNQPPTLWTQVKEWLDQALLSTFKTSFDTERATALELHKLKEELIWLQSDVVSPDCKVGFCHNDLLAANVLAGDDKIQLIDFEYGGINYLSYDIANHFNEFAGGTDPDATPDYSKFPSPQLQRDFVTEYLVTMSATMPTEEEIDTLLKEIKGFVMANHLVWGLWGINQAATEGCDVFDYMKYGTYRIQEYYKVKNEWTKSI